MDGIDIICCVDDVHRLKKSREWKVWTEPPSPQRGNNKKKAEGREKARLLTPLNFILNYFKLRG